MAASSVVRKFAAILIVLGTSVSSLSASVDLPLHHWVYDDLERLAALGAIRGAMISAKPFSR
ncbi:MAG: hypothetical protein OEW21_16875, partial [Betaproteobacteria bacterium]|nr:hypothetical protein [Betaproteobacteria bacterium]